MSIVSIFSMPSAIQSPAAGDIDGDGKMEVLPTVGCLNMIHTFCGVTSQIEWSFQLGTRNIGTPSISDIDDDGFFEIVVPSHDGQV